jgi:hypothetical protein
MQNIVSGRKILYRYNGKQDISACKEICPIPKKKPLIKLKPKARRSNIDIKLKM